MSHPFWSRVDASGDCWEWVAGRNGNGYGITYASGKAQVAHRWAYEELVGGIPAGLTLDHLCRNKRCVNPDHLEPVTQRVNTLRGHSRAAVNARKSHCIHGHELTPDNVYIVRLPTAVSRYCRTCRRQGWRALRARRRQAA